MAETFYLNKDNVSRLELRTGGALQDISTLTKVEIKISGVVYSSADHADAFDWTTEGSNGILHLALGKISNLVASRDKKAELILYDASNPNGIVWGTIDVKILDLADE